jgi:hypothetical protein
MAKGPDVPPVFAALIIGVALGGFGGYYGRMYMDSDRRGSQTASQAAPAGMGGGGGGGGGMMGGMGGGGSMMGGGGAPPPGMILARTVRNLSTMQTVQGKGITPEQSAKLLPLLEKIQKAEKLPEKEAQAAADELDKVLTEPQKEALAAMSPQRGGGGGGRGGGGMGGPGGGMGGAPGGGPPGGGMTAPGGSGGGGGMVGMGGGQPDPEKPFANERNKGALDNLVGALKGAK